MGVPKLFRWLSERYPLINRSADALPKPEFDNLYLDLNGVIHYSSHAQSDFVENKSEQEIASGIFSYIERLFDIASPKKVLFIAIDGVAPRAKINQQRMRRFRSAHSRQMEKERRAAEGEEGGEIFDSNCITPGTTFLERITDHLSYYVRSKVDSDAQWQGIEVILSGPQVPGEGEHKIMEYIRRAKLQPGYDANTRHCLYGLDGDLMLLSTAAHEPHFALLREKVVMRRGRAARDKKEASLQSTGEFQFLHVSLLREYVAADLKAVASRERVLDDFIFLSFFVGNDFLPPLPFVEIDDGGLEFLFQAYRAISVPRDPPRPEGEISKEVAAQLEAAKKKAESERPFLVDAVNGVINREFLVAVLRSLVARESSTFEEKLSQSRGDSDDEDSDAEMRGDDDDNEEDAADGADPAPPQLKDDAILEVGADASAADAKASSDLKAALGIDSGAAAEADAGSQPRSTEWRDSFYAGKKDLPLLGRTEGFEEVSDELLQGMVQNYIEGLIWVLRYYYHGVPSWSWFYGYHFAPLVTDIVRHLDKAATVTFALDTPFTPLEQLMSVLPFESRSLLPACYRQAIEAGDETIAPYFPKEFGFHLDEKNREWRNTPLIPFVDQAVLKAFCGKHEKELTAEEQKRNAFGPAYSYKYSATSTLPCPATLSAFADIQKCHCEVAAHKPPPVPEGKTLSFEPRLLPGAHITVPSIPPGFPTLYGLPCSTRVDSIGVNVFGWSSRNDSLVLTCRGPVPASEQQFKACVSQLLGKPVLVWPFFEQALVYSIITKFGEFSLLPNGKVHSTHFSAEQLSAKLRQLAPSRWRSRYAVEVTDPNLISLRLRVLKGMERSSSGDIAPRYEDTPSRSVPLQCVYHGEAQRVLSARDKRYVPQEAPAVSETFVPGCSVVSIQPGNMFGLCGECVAVEDESVRVRFTNVGKEPQFSVDLANDIRFKHTFSSVSTCARMLKVGPLCLTRIAGSVTFRVPREGAGFRKTDLGLQLKYQGRKLRMWEYSKLDSNGKWLFSDKAVELMREYRNRFPEVWEAVEADSRRALYDAESLVPGQSGDGKDVDADEEWREVVRNRAADIGNWLDGLPTASRPLLPCSIQYLSQEAITLIEEEGEGVTRKEKVTEKKMHASNLFTPATTSAQAQLNWPGGPSSPAPPDAMELGDRVLYMLDKGPVGFGARGSVVGLTPMHADVVFDDVQLCGTTLGGRLRTLRGVEIPRSHLLNMSKTPQGGGGGGGANKKKQGRGGGGKKKPANPFDLLN